MLVFDKRERERERVCSSVVNKRKREFRRRFLFRCSSQSPNYFTPRLSIV